MAEIAEIKVYKMGDHEWWATKWSLKDTYNYYVKEYRLSETDTDIREVTKCNIDEEGMWRETRDAEDIKKLGDSDEVVKVEVVNGQTRKKRQFGDLLRGEDERIFKFVPFREVLRDHGNITEPFCLATLEW